MLQAHGAVRSVGRRLSRPALLAVIGAAPVGILAGVALASQWSIAKVSLDDPAPVPFDPSSVLPKPGSGHLLCDLGSCRYQRCTGECPPPCVSLFPERPGETRDALSRFGPMTWRMREEMLHRLGSGQARAIAAIDLCLDPEGRVTSVSLQRSSRSGVVDRILMARMRTMPSGPWPDSTWARGRCTTVTVIELR